MLPPNLLRNFIKSFISGSIAQFFKTVFPLALNEAKIAFSVAPTEILGRVILFPFNPSFALAKIYPFFIYFYFLLQVF